MQIPVSTKCRLQTAECRPDTKCRLQTAEWVQNADWEFKVFFCLVCDDMSSYNLPSVTQSLFHDQLSWLFVLLWNIPGPFLDQNNSWYNFKPSCSLLALRASWLAWRLYRFYQLNKSRCCCRCKCDVTIENLTRAIFEKQSTALHVVRIIIFLSGICLFRWQKCGPRPKLFLRLDKFSTLVDHIILTYLYKLIIPGNRIKKAC